MKYKSVILKEAKVEFRKSFYWYKDINPNLSHKFLASFKISLSEISENPFLFQTRYDNVRIKNFDNFPYLIHYRIIDDLIIRASVCHSFRDGDLNQF